MGGTWQKPEEALWEGLIVRKPIILGRSRRIQLPGKLFIVFMFNFITYFTTSYQEKYKPFI